MKSILAIVGTPRKGGNSEILAECMMKGAAAAGAVVEKVSLGDLKIGYCTACDACQKTVEATCVQKDDMIELYSRLRQADGYILASPIYFFTMSGQMKVFLDRTYAMGGAGSFTAMQGKKAALAFTYGDSNPVNSGVMNAVRTFQDAFAFLGVRNVGCVHAACGAAGEVKRNAAVLKEAEELGRKLVEGIA